MAYFLVAAKDLPKETGRAAVARAKQEGGGTGAICISAPDNTYYLGVEGARAASLLRSFLNSRRVSFTEMAQLPSEVVDKVRRTQPPRPGSSGRGDMVDLVDAVVTIIEVITRR